MLGNFLKQWAVAGVGLFAVTVPLTSQGEDLVELRILAFPSTNTPTPLKLLSAEGKTIMIDTPSLEFSQPYSVPLQSVWKVGESQVGESGVEDFKVLGESKALASSKQFLILQRSGAKNSDGFKVTPIDSQPSVFVGGSFFFLNLSQVVISGKVGDQEFTLEHGKHTIVAPDPSTDESSEVSAVFQDKERPRPFFSSMWPLSSGSRSLIIFYDHPQNGRLRLHAVREFLP